MKLKKQVILILLMIFSFNIFTNKAKAGAFDYELRTAAWDEEHPYTANYLDTISTGQDDLIVCQYNRSPKDPIFNAHDEGEQQNSSAIANRIIYRMKQNNQGEKKFQWEMSSVFFARYEKECHKNWIGKTICDETYDKVFDDNFSEYEDENGIAPIIATWKGDSQTLPKVFYGEPTNDDINEWWNTDTQSHKDLVNSFSCPKWYYYDRSVENAADADNHFEICYEDKYGDCSSRNEDGSDFTYGRANGDIVEGSLRYSFTEELETLLTKMQEKVINMTDEDIYLYYDSKYDTKLQEEREKEYDNFCRILRENTNNEDNTDRINEIYKETEEESTKRSMNRLISETMKEVNPSSPNINFFTNGMIGSGLLIEKPASGLTYGNNPVYDRVQNLFLGNGRDIKYNGSSLTTKYNTIKNIVAKKNANNIQNYSKRCAEEFNDSELELDVEELEMLEEKIIEELSKVPALYEKIDFDADLNCENIFADFADVIKSAYFFIEIGAIIIVIAFTALDYAKIILADNQDEFKKANKRLTQRLIVLVVIFLLPAILNTTLRMFKIEGFDSDHPLCIDVTE